MVASAASSGIIGMMAAILLAMIAANLLAMIRAAAADRYGCRK